MSTIANRYARALADVVLERREVNEVTGDLQSFAELMTQSQELRDVFASPVIALERKRAILHDLLARLNLRPTAANFLQLLLSNLRLHDLDQMLQALARELDARSSIVSAQLTTARVINEQEKNMLRDRLQTATGKEVRLNFATDPEIIGGVVTRIGSTIYDGSIKSQLAQMKERLMKA